ncbi:unnamed protein product, partial [Rotaria magnacalcarata]
NTKIDRQIGTKSFETLVTEGLLLNDYFIITNTHRPILCYAKFLPTNDDEREKLSKSCAFITFKQSYNTSSSSTSLPNNSIPSLRTIPNQQITSNHCHVSSTLIHPGYQSSERHIHNRIIRKSQNNNNTFIQDVDLAEENDIISLNEIQYQDNLIMDESSLRYSIKLN